MEAPALAVSSASNQSYDLFNSLEEIISNDNDVGNANISGSGIRIRTRQRDNQPSADISWLQGAAPRRIRLQMNIQGGSIRCDSFREFSCEEENPVAKPFVAKLISSSFKLTF